MNSYLFKKTIELATKLLINSNVDAIGTLLSRDIVLDGAM
jgi:hypothetical protein